MTKEYYEEHKEEIKSKVKNYYDVNRDKINFKRREDRKLNPNKYKKDKEKSKNYYQNNKEEILLKQKQDYQDNKEVIQVRHRLYDQTPKGRYISYVKSAKKRNKIFDITPEQYENFFYDKKCNYCPNITTGIDRVDNFLGYSVENCAPCCWDCNEMKKGRTKEQFLNHNMEITANTFNITTDELKNLIKFFKLKEG